MKIVGFNFTKISSWRSPDFKRTPISTNIEFKDIEKEKLEILTDQEALKVLFNFSIVYQDKEAKKEEDKQGEVSFEGFLVLVATKEEAKDIQKNWKKKKLSPALQIPLYNFILKKCTPKAVFLEDELNLPSHMPIPQVSAQKKEE